MHWAISCLTSVAASSLACVVVEGLHSPDRVRCLLRRHRLRYRGRVGEAVPELKGYGGLQGGQQGLLKSRGHTDGAGRCPHVLSVRAATAPHQLVAPASMLNIWHLAG